MGERAPQRSHPVGVGHGSRQALRQPNAVLPAFQQAQRRPAGITGDEQGMAIRHCCGRDLLQRGVRLGDEQPRQRLRAPARQVVRFGQRRQPGLLGRELDNKGAVVVGYSLPGQHCQQPLAIRLEAATLPLGRVLLDTGARYHRDLVVGHSQDAGSPAPLDQLAAQPARVDALGQQRMRPQPAQRIGSDRHMQHKRFARVQPRLEIAAHGRAADSPGRAFFYLDERKAAQPFVTRHAAEERQPFPTRVTPDQPGAVAGVEDLLDQAMDAFL